MKTEITGADVTQCILDTVKRYIAENDDINSAYDINNGHCMDFADDVIEQLGGQTENLFIFSCENLMTGEDGNPDENDFWDVRLIEMNWKNIKPTNGLTWRDMDRIPFAESHEWICFNGRHYDAQCPEGVDNLFDLPIYKQYISDYIEFER